MPTNLEKLTCSINFKGTQSILCTLLSKLLNLIAFKRAFEKLLTQCFQVHLGLYVALAVLTMRSLFAELVIITVDTPVSDHNTFLGLSTLDSKEG